MDKGPAAKAMETRLKRLARQAALPDGSPCLTLSADQTRTLARDDGLSLRLVEMAALGSGIVPERYLRNLRALSLEEQLRLLASRAVIVGLGGLGGHVLEILVRAGVGDIRAADHDVFEASNLNRQLLAQASSLGMPKAEAAAKRVAEINPGVEFRAERALLDQAGMNRLLRDADVALDCLGGLECRNMLRQAARAQGVPLVTAAVAGMAGFAALILPGHAEPPDLFPADPATRSAEQGLGCPAPSVALAAAGQASLALDVLRGQGERHAGSALFFDLTDLDFTLVKPGAA